MADENKDVRRVEKASRVELDASLKTKMIGIVNDSNPSIGFKKSDGTTEYITAEGGDAEYNSVTISGLAGGATVIGVDANGLIVPADAQGSYSAGDANVLNVSDGDGGWDATAVSVETIPGEFGGTVISSDDDNYLTIRADGAGATLALLSLTGDISAQATSGDVNLITDTGDIALISTTAEITANQPINQASDGTESYHTVRKGQVYTKTETDLAYQPKDATLTALAGLATGADKVPYSTGVDTFSEMTVTSFARTFLDDTTASGVRTTIGATKSMKTVTASGTGLTVGNWYTIAEWDATGISSAPCILTITQPDTPRTTLSFSANVGLLNVQGVLISRATTSGQFSEVRLCNSSASANLRLLQVRVKSVAPSAAYVDYLSLSAVSTWEIASITPIGYRDDSAVVSTVYFSIVPETGTYATIASDNNFSVAQRCQATAAQILALGAKAIPNLEYLAMTTAGDMVYATTGGQPVRLPKGTASQIIQMNSGATAPEWTSTPSFGTTGKTTFESTGHQVMTDDATVWEDANFDPTMLTGGGTQPSPITFASTGMTVAAFSGSQTDEISATFEIPHCAKLNAAGQTSVVCSFHGHIYPTNTAGGDCRFGLEYLFTKEGIAVTTSTTLYVTVTLPTTAWAKKSFSFADIVVPEELGSQMHWRFFRLGADPLDTATADVACATVGLHYEIDSVGSRQRLTK